MTPEERARAAWERWKAKTLETRPNNFADEVAEFFDAEDDGLLAEFAVEIQEAIAAEREACAAIADTAAAFFEKRAAEDSAVAPIMKAALSNAREYAAAVRSRVNG